MKEYIERKAFIEKCTEILPDKPSDYKDGVFNAVKIANALPKADVKEVVHANWVGGADGYADGELVYDIWSCSACGKVFDEWEDKPTWKFCPNCGADMMEQK